MEINFQVCKDCHRPGSDEMLTDGICDMCWDKRARNLLEEVSTPIGTVKYYLLRFRSKLLGWFA